MKFRNVSIQYPPGFHVLRLTVEWAGLPAGTLVTPLYAGTGGRTVVVFAGPRKGQRVSG